MLGTRTCGSSRSSRCAVGERGDPPSVEFDDRRAYRGGPSRARRRRPGARRGARYGVLLVHGFVSNREVYGAYLRGLKESNLLDTNGCQRVLMMGATNVRHVVAGPFIPGEYFEVLAFPSQQAIEAFWFSPLYAPLIELRRGAVDVLAAVLPPG